MPRAPSHRLDDRATEKLLNHPKVLARLPSIAKHAKKTAKVVKRCSSCGGGTRKRKMVTRKTDLNAVREHIASLPQEKKKQLLRLLNTNELVVPYVRSQDKRRVKLKIN